VTVTDVSLDDAVKPVGVVRKSVVAPGLTGVNGVTTWSEPATMVTGEGMVPTPVLVLARDTGTEAIPPRSAWVKPRKHGVDCGTQLVALVFSTPMETVIWHAARPLLKRQPFITLALKL
jgi:hypothetical protein